MEDAKNVAMASEQIDVTPTEPTVQSPNPQQVKTGMSKKLKIILGVIGGLVVLGILGVIIIVVLFSAVFKKAVNDFEEVSELNVTITPVTTEIVEPSITDLPQTEESVQDMIEEMYPDDQAIEIVKPQVKNFPSTDISKYLSTGFNPVTITLRPTPGNVFLAEYQGQKIINWSTTSGENMVYKITPAHKAVRWDEEVDGNLPSLSGLANVWQLVSVPFSTSLELLTVDVSNDSNYLYLSYIISNYIYNPAGDPSSALTGIVRYDLGQKKFLDHFSYYFNSPLIAGHNGGMYLEAAAANYLVANIKHCYACGSNPSTGIVLNWDARTYSVLQEWGHDYLIHYGELVLEFTPQTEIGANPDCIECDPLLKDGDPVFYYLP